MNFILQLKRDITTACGAKCIVLIDILSGLIIDLNLSESRHQSQSEGIIVCIGAIQMQSIRKHYKRKLILSKWCSTFLTCISLSLPSLRPQRNSIHSPTQEINYFVFVGVLKTSSSADGLALESWRIYIQTSYTISGKRVEKLHLQEYVGGTN